MCTLFAKTARPVHFPPGGNTPANVWVTDYSVVLCPLVLLTPKSMLYWLAFIPPKDYCLDPFT
jgi:hypothetical protein